MSSTILPQQDAVASPRLYRAMWRRHFDAGLHLVPFTLSESLSRAAGQSRPGGAGGHCLPEGDAACALIAVVALLLPKRIKESGSAKA